MVEVAYPYAFTLTAFYGVDVFTSFYGENGEKAGKCR
jgi:hypothetical protein